MTTTTTLPLSCINAKDVLPKELRNASIVDEIISEIYNGWPGRTGEERVLECLKLISERVPEYAKATGKTELEFLNLYAKSRNCNYTNWFQSSRLPSLSDVLIFNTADDFKKQFPSGKYLCPACGEATTDYQECNSGKKIKGVVCNWKVYGLFGGLGKEVRVILKDRIEDFPRPVSIFPPIELTLNNEQKVKECDATILPKAPQPGQK
jgi:hypothetical protein